MGCAEKFGQIVLVVLNLLFLVASLVLIAFGVLLRFFANKILTLLATLHIDSSANKLGIPNVQDVSQLPFLSEIGLTLLIFGFVLFLVSFSACCGACCQYRPLLILFVILMLILVLAEAVVGGLFLEKDSALHKAIQDDLKKEMKTKYNTSTQATDRFSIAVNIMNYMLKCCGIEGQSDFESGLPAKSCCRRDKIKTGSSDCDPTNAANKVNFYTDGCYSKLQDVILQHQALAAVILAFIIFFQVVEAVIAFLLVRKDNAVGAV